MRRIRIGLQKRAILYAQAFLDFIHRAGKVTRYPERYRAPEMSFLPFHEVMNYYDVQHLRKDKTKFT